MVGDRIEPVVGWPVWIGLVCEDLAGQRDWYARVFGLAASDAGEDWVQFNLAGQTFELLRADPSTPQYGARRYQVGFEVADIHAARDHLVAAGADAVGEIEGGPDSGYWAYFRDPEGNVFEVKQVLHGGPRRGGPA